ncbi:MAG TPA: hypothetical protein VGV13_20970 [Methylomirabilota bacterium]|nr:hypothetical protein [Methylomirabilota bacterium]
MRIPNADRAIIDATKLHGYLLSQRHPVGRFKAGFFLGLGYSAREWQRLEADLRAQHLSREATAAEGNPYGQKYEIHAPLEGPTGRAAEVISVWVVLVNEDFRRFVTAYPGGER